MRRTRVRLVVRLVPILLAAAALLAAGCSEQRDSGAKAPGAPAREMTLAQPESPAPDAGDAAAVSVPVVRRTLIRNASIALVVTTVDSAAARIERVVAREGGYVEHAAATQRGGFPYRDYRVRVPAARLDPVLAEFRALAVRVDSETQDVQDVTDQVVDSEARLRTLRATELELLALLRESRSRGQKVQDIMAVYRELTQIRTQIEQLDGQLQSLKDLAAMSAIQIALAPDQASGPIQPQRWRPGETIRSSLRSLVVMLRGLADLTIRFLIVGIPLLVILGGAGWLIARAVRVLQRRAKDRGQTR